MVKRKTYVAQSLSGAQSRVRQLENLVAHLNDRLGEYMEQKKELLEHRRTLAKLAAEGPAFDNPLIINAAKELRNAVLRYECKLNPDGTFLKG